jgi:hypothetical protein
MYTQNTQEKYTQIWTWLKWYKTLKTKKKSIFNKHDRITHFEFDFDNGHQPMDVAYSAPVLQKSKLLNASNIL